MHILQIIKSGIMCEHMYVTHVYIYCIVICGDICFLGAFVKALNISITLVSPVLDTPLKLFHKEALPDVVIVANGLDCGSEYPTTHFSATSTYSVCNISVIHNRTIHMVYNDHLISV